MGFLERYRGKCSQLFILGDLFEMWVGDDAPSALAESVALALADFVTAGAEVAIMHGNRDFLIGEAYAARCRARLMAESEIITSGSREILLMHGDSLCTDDTDYQEFRSLVRQPDWQATFLAQPLEARLAFATQARAQSREATATKANDIMDVNQAAVEQQLQAASVDRIVHGHTHRPARHAVGSGERIVLGDWTAEKGWYLRERGNDLSLNSFAIR